MDSPPQFRFLGLVTTPLHRLAFGEQLRTLRRKAGWSSQEAFAHHLGLDRTYVSGIERGVRNPTLDVLVLLAHGLDLKPADLLANLSSSCVETGPESSLPCRSCAAGTAVRRGPFSSNPHDPSSI